MHFDEGTLQRFLHGELRSDARSTFEKHAASCAECRARLEETERDERAIMQLLRAVDEPTPGLDAASIVRRAEAAPRYPVARARWTRRVAAVLAAAAIAGAAYAIPGSPIRAWWREVVREIAGPPKPDSGPAGRAPAVSGIAVSPGTRLVIDVASGASEARVRLTDGREVEVRAPSGAAGFRSSPERLTVVPQRSGTVLEVLIPRSAPRVEIRAGGSQVFLKQGADVTTEGTGSGDGWAISLAGP